MAQQYDATHGIVENPMASLIRCYQAQYEKLEKYGIQKAMAMAEEKPLRRHGATDRAVCELINTNMGHSRRLMLEGFSDDDVALMRHMRDNQKISLLSIAKEFNCQPNVVEALLRVHHKTKKTSHENPTTEKHHAGG